MIKNLDSSYVEQERKAYALYVLEERAIPHLADGLKSAGRRVIWMARNGQKYKTATLAGATMVLHPHAAPDGVINTLTAKYGNNIPLFTGIGSFGTLLSPDDYGASRYTTILLSDFTKDVVLKDIEIIPMKDNYDGSLQEPEYFLPLIPLVLLNPSDGIAIGYASTILPRSLQNIIDSQISVLTNRQVNDVNPHFIPTDNQAIRQEITPNGKIKWTFSGEYDIVGANTIRITKLPYGVKYEKYQKTLNDLIDSGIIKTIIDKSKDTFDILIKLNPESNIDIFDTDSVKSKLGLFNSVVENLNVLDFDGNKLRTMTYVGIIQEFTSWRLHWYVKRYQLIKSNLEHELQKYKDIVLSITKKIGDQLKRVDTKQDLMEWIQGIGVVNVEYISTLPVYRFTDDERKKAQDKIDSLELQLINVNFVLDNENERVKIYIQELKEIRKKYCKS